MVGIAIPATFVGLALMIALGVPLIGAFGVAAIALYTQSAYATTLTTVGTMSVDGIASFTLLAIPLFILTGDLIVATDVADDLYQFAESLFSWLPGGLGAATQAACGLFAAISGSNTADAAAIGRVSSSELKERNYPSDYAGGLVAAASITGILIPPSVSYIVLGLTMRLSISKLFIGTIIPGLIVLSSMIVVHLFIGRRRGIEQNTSSISPRKIIKSAWGAKYGLLVPFLIIGGIYAGIFTPTESATVAIAFMIFIGVVVSGLLDFEEYIEVFTRSGALNGIISPLVAIFTLFSQSIGFFKIPEKIINLMFSLSGGSEALIIVFVIIILIAAGTVISTIPNILLLGPLIIPIGVELGYNVYHFSIFFLVILALGFITPPVGLNLFVLAGIIDEPVEKLAVQAFPFFIVGLVAGIFVLLFPSTVLILI